MSSGPFCRACTVDAAYALAITEYERLATILNQPKHDRFIECEGINGESVLLRAESVEALIEFTAVAIERADASELTGG